ncbi:RHS domain-containing protein [Enterobacter bugandensis]|uniref:RHS domain-containing protein n=1 Tax=Enterobacter cloacae complex sp. P14RS TaxID=2779579 RepID=UPI0032E4D78B
MECAADLSILRPDSDDPLALTDDINAPEIFWFHYQPNGTPERIVDIEGQMRWEGANRA